MGVMTQITRILNAKTDIANTLRNKGVTVPSATRIEGYAALVNQIPKITGVTLIEGEPEEENA